MRVSGVCVHALVNVCECMRRVWGGVWWVCVCSVYMCECGVYVCVVCMCECGVCICVSVVYVSICATMLSFLLGFWRSEFKSSCFQSKHFIG